MRKVYAFVHLMCITGYPYHVKRAVFFGRYIFKINPAYISHGRKFHLRIKVPDDFFQVVFCAKFPGAMFTPGKIFLGGFISDFHIINAGA